MGIPRKKSKRKKTTKAASVPSQEGGEVVAGVLRLHSRGFGFVQTDPSFCYTQDIFIPRHSTKHAVDGDRVEVALHPGPISEKGPEGKIIAILARSRRHMAGTIRQGGAGGDILAYVPLLGAKQKVIVEAEEGISLEPGDRIVMEVLDWGTKETGVVCRFSHRIGNMKDPSCDVAAAVEEFELHTDFSSATLAEAAAYGRKIPLQECKKRKDLRSWELVTIDPDTAKDFDDAISLTKDAKGHFHLGVHIADVAHYVRSGTSLDREAFERGNSTYFPGTCLPMLPKELSENLCSLKPKVNRLAVTVLMELDANGALVSHQIFRSVIRSAARLTYRQAKQILDQEKTSVHAPLLFRMQELCRLLKKKRYERGSLEFSVPELVVLVDPQGDPYGTDLVVYDVTHQMIEEFMLKANEMVAIDLSGRGKNLTYRVHDQPAEENLRDFAQMAAAFGFKISDQPTPKELQHLFEEAAATSFSVHLATHYIRRMRLASYSPENIGHYGLGLTHYCHFTSPIRRYVDLVVHRILFGEGDDIDWLQKISQHCSEQERVSAKAEGSVKLLKKLRLLRKMYEQFPLKMYKAMVTRIKPFGLYFEIEELFLEGFLHISELGEEYYVFDENRMQLKGRSTGKVFGVGSSILVAVQEIDEVTQEVKWYLGEVSPKKRRKA